MNYKPTQITINLPAFRHLSGDTLAAPVNRFSHKSLLLFTLAFLLLFLSACQSTGATWQQVQDTGILHVGLDPTYPPFENADGGELIGFDVDLARALASELGVEASFSYFGYDGLYDALATRQVDVLISALVVQPERTRDFAYTVPYFDTGQRLVVPAGSPISSLNDLAGHTVAVEIGADGHVQATELARRLPDLQITPYNSPDETLSALSLGAADAAIVDNISALTHQQTGLHLLEEPVTVEPIAMVLRIEDEMLLDEINQALAGLEQSGRLTTIRQSWFNE